MRRASNHQIQCLLVGDLFPITEYFNTKFIMCRNFNELPEKLLANDIDIISAPCERKIWLEIFRQLSEVVYDVRLVWTSYYVDKYRVCITREHYVEFDINHRLEWLNVVYFDISKANLKKYNSNIYTLCDAENYFLIFCHNFLYGGINPKKYHYLYSAIKDQSRFDNLITDNLKVAPSRIINFIEGKQRYSRTQVNFIRVLILLKSLSLKNIFLLIKRYFIGSKFSKMNLKDIYIENLPQ